MGIYNQYLKNIDLHIDQESKTAMDLSDDLAHHPEISGEEYESSKKIVRILKNEGFDVEYPFCDMPTAFKAKKGKGKTKVALMVEYDALPGLGHACGHCVHGAMSVLAAIALGKIIEDIDGTLYAIGTPAEESDGAKCAMSDLGVFDKMDLAIMIHSSSGDINTSGFRSLAMDGYKFTFKGRSSHAAGAPWEGKNALNGLQLMFHAIDMLRQHVRPEARIHGVIDSGGTAPNIVPDSASCRFEFRAPKRPYLNEIVEKCMNCAKGAALATETEVTWGKFESSFDDMLPNQSGENLIEKIYEELNIPITKTADPTGSTDVGNVTYRCPALQPTLSITSELHSLHTVEFAEKVTKEEAHQAIVKGAKVLSRAALKTILDPQIRSSMKRDFQKQIER